MIEVAVWVFTAFIAAIIAYTALLYYPVAGYGKAAGVLREPDWILEKTPAQASYFMFVMQSVIMISAAAYAFRVSNHVILSLDIIYFISILMPVLYHNLKEARSLSIQ